MGLLDYPGDLVKDPCLPSHHFSGVVQVYQAVKVFSTGTAMAAHQESIYAECALGFLTAWRHTISKCRSESATMDADTEFRVLPLPASLFPWQKELALCREVFVYLLFNSTLLFQPCSPPPLCMKVALPALSHPYVEWKK